MSRHTVEESAFRGLALDREDRVCPVCGGGMHIRNRRSRSILTLDGHAQHPGVFTGQDLTRFATATPPASQLASQQRHGNMKKPAQKNHSPEPARSSITQSQ